MTPLERVLVRTCGEKADRFDFGNKSALALTLALNRLIDGRPVLIGTFNASKEFEGFPAYQVRKDGEYQYLTAFGRAKEADIKARVEAENGVANAEIRTPNWEHLIFSGQVPEGSTIHVIYKMLKNTPAVQSLLDYPISAPEQPTPGPSAPTQEDALSLIRSGFGLRDVPSDLWVKPVIEEAIARDRRNYMDLPDDWKFEDTPQYLKAVSEHDGHTRIETRGGMAYEAMMVLAQDRCDDSRSYEMTVRQIRGVIDGILESGDFTLSNGEAIYKSVCGEGLAAPDSVAGIAQSQVYGIIRDQVSVLIATAEMFEGNNLANSSNTAPACKARLESPSP